MNPRKASIILTTLLVLTVLLAATVLMAQADPVEKEVLLIVDQRNAWPDCKLPDLIIGRLAEHSFLRIADPRIAGELPEYPTGVLPRDDLMALGQRSSCRFIIWCSVDREDLIRENNFSIPLIAKQRRVKAILSGKYHILDCERARVIRNGKIDLIRHGPSSLQVVDFGDADPELLVSYRDRQRLFIELETEAAEQIEKDVLQVAKLR